MLKHADFDQPNPINILRRVDPWMMMMINDDDDDNDDDDNDDDDDVSGSGDSPPNVWQLEWT